MVHTAVAVHPLTIGLLVEWLLAIVAGLTGAFMVMIGMIEEIPRILRSTAARIFNTQRS